MDPALGPWMAPSRLVETFRQLGFTASWSADDGEIVEFEAVGFDCHVVPYPPTDLQLATGFLRSDAGYSLSTINELNLRLRFAKLVIDLDGDLLVLMDISFAKVEAAAIDDLLKDCLDTWVEVVSDVVASLRTTRLP